MQRSILASAILLSITACDSDSVNLTSDPDAGTVTIADTTFESPAEEDTATVVAEAPLNDDDKNDDTATTVVVVNNDDGKNDDKPEVVVDDSPEVTVVDETEDSQADGNTGNNTSDEGQTADNSSNNAGSDADNSTTNNGQISDDAGSSSDVGGTTTDSGDSGSTDASDEGQAEDNSSNNAGSDTSDGGQISDDAGSATSDGGQTSDDAGSDTSDGGQISDDAGSATSDGGQISDDAGSATSDGGQISDDADSSTSDGGDTNADSSNNGSTDNGSSSQGPVVTNAGSFTSTAADGDVLRVSSLVSGSSENICTTLSDQSNFSDTNVGDFILHNNAWRPFRAFPGYEWEQCITTNTNGAVVGWNYDWGPGQPGANGRASDDFFVRSYPELIFGTKDEFRTSAPTSVTGLPVMVSEMPTFRIDYSYNGPQFGDERVVDASNNARFPNGTIIQGERNVAVEAFFYETDASGNCSADTVVRNGGSNHEYEVMVWLDAGAERLPAGPNNFVADLNIRGADYKVYTKDSDERYIAFVAQNPQTTGTIYWNDFTDWARENAHVVRERFGALSNSVQIQDDWCMANILIGTEIFWGAGSMEIMDWTITQSR